MISSGQVSQMFAQQNQMFAGNAMYSQQISQQMPGMYTGSFGQPGFSYGGSGSNFSNQVGGGVVSAMGGVAQFGLGAGALMAGLGMGGPMRYALDPFAGAGAMYRAGGALGMGMGGRLAMGAVGMLPAMAVMAGAQHVIGSTVAGAQEQAGIERVLGQRFGTFSNPSTGGRGFNRQQSMVIGDMVRQMDSLPEMMTSMGELTRIMDRMGQMGIMNGVTNVRDFGTKFKSTLGVLKELSKVIGSTMEEALPLLGEIRRSGMYSNSDILKNAMQRQVVGGLTGMNQAQVGQTAAYGAQLGFATGGSRGTGARHALRMAGQLGMANQLGMLSNDQIMELTGMEGAEGIQALSGQLTQAGYRMSQGALGTAMSIAMAEQSGGRFTGKMDAALMERFRRGDISKGEMLRMVHQKTASRGSKMSYVANRGRLRSEMAGEMGVEGQMAMLGMVLGERGYDNPDALNIVSQGFGLDEREAGLLVDLGKKMPDINLEMRSRGRATAKRIAQEAFMKENYSWDAIKTKVGKRVESVISEPFKKFGAELRHTITTAVDEFVDEVTGKYKVEVTQGMSNLLRGAGSNLGESRNRLAGMLSGGVGRMVGGALGTGGDMSAGTLGSAINFLTGTTTAGERAADAMSLTTVGRSGLRTVSDGAVSDAYRSRGFNILDSNRNTSLLNPLGVGAGSTNVMATDAGMAAAGERLRGLVSGQIGADDSLLKEISQSPDFAAAKADILYKGAFGKDVQGGGFDRLRARYGEADITAAAAGGKYSGLARQALSKYGADADLLMISPDRQKAISDRIKGFESGSAQKIFGREGAEEFKSIMKGLQGSKAGDFVMNMYGRDFGSGPQTASQAQMGKAAWLVGLGNEGAGRDIMGRAVDLFGGLSSWGAFSDDAQNVVEGRGDDSRDDYFKRLAAKEMAGERLTAGEAVEVDKHREAYEATKDQIMLANVAAKGSSPNPAWSGEEEKFLAKMGYDKNTFTPEVAKQFGKLNELMGKAKIDPGAREELREYAKNLKGQAITEIAQRFSAKGKSVSSAVAALRGSGFKLGAAEQAALKKIEAYAGRMAKMTTLGDIQEGYGIDSKTGKVKPGATSVTEDMGQLAYDLASKPGMDDKALGAVLSTDDDLSAAYGRARHTISRLRSRKTFDTFFDKDAASKMSVADQARLGEIREQFFDKSGRVKDEAKFVKFMAGDEGQKLVTAAGAEQRSKYASQADIAKNMESFGQSVASLAQIVQTMKDGKEGKK